jgi:hypothetical protein
MFTPLCSPSRRPSREPSGGGLRRGENPQEGADQAARARHLRRVVPQCPDDVAESGNLILTGRQRDDRVGLGRRLELAPQGVHVLGVYPGPIDTPMQPGEDRSAMTDPADIADAVYDALEAGEYELLTDEMAAKVHGALAAPVSALYPALAK